MAQQERRPKTVQDRACRAAGSHSSDIMLGLERKRFYRCAAALLSWQARARVSRFSSFPPFCGSFSVNI